MQYTHLSLSQCVHTHTLSVCEWGMVALPHQVSSARAFTTHQNQALFVSFFSWCWKVWFLSPIATPSAKLPASYWFDGVGVNRIYDICVGVDVCMCERECMCVCMCVCGESRSVQYIHVGLHCSIRPPVGQAPNSNVIVISDLDQFEYTHMQCKWHFYVSVVILLFSLFRQVTTGVQ